MTKRLLLLLASPHNSAAHIIIRPRWISPDDRRSVLPGAAHRAHMQDASDVLVARTQPAKASAQYCSGQSGPLVFDWRCFCVSPLELQMNNMLDWLTLPRGTMEEASPGDSSRHRRQQRARKSQFSRARGIIAPRWSVKNSRQYSTVRRDPCALVLLQS